VVQRKSVTVMAGGEAVADFRAARSVVQLEQVVTTATGAQRAVELGHVVSMVKATGFTPSGQPE